MNAVALFTQSTLVPGDAKLHVEHLSELLRDVDLEARMMTLIKAHEFVKENESNEILLRSIRADLEVERSKMNKMIFVIEQAQLALRAEF
ncbi:MAG TPA: hypothetical protein VNJ01_14235 [Bacteriovoracaceae bacterium]|nr:hypothetical protein [Bacteriovoracaceae bacterium]